jgi:hypothetical protein
MCGESCIWLFAAGLGAIVGLGQIYGATAAFLERQCSLAIGWGRLCQFCWIV